MFDIGHNVKLGVQPMSAYSKRKIAICEAALEMTKRNFAIEVDCSRTTLWKPPYSPAVLEKLATIESKVLGILRDEFGPIEGSLQTWREVIVKKVNELDVLESVPSLTVGTNCPDALAFGIIVHNQLLEPEIREGSIIIVSPRTKLINGSLCAGELLRGGLVYGSLQRAPDLGSGKFLIVPYNRKYEPQPFEDKDFRDGACWTVYATHTQIK